MPFIRARAALLPRAIVALPLPTPLRHAALISLDTPLPLPIDAIFFFARYALMPPRPLRRCCYFAMLFARDA